MIGAAGILLCLLMLVTATGIDVGQAQGNGLVVAYNFDQGSGTTLTDVSGTGNHGTISGGVTWTTTAKFGTALSFDGVNGLVTINDSNSLDLTNRFTLEAWVRPTATTGWRTLLLKEAPSDLAYGVYANDGSSRPSVWLRPSGTSGGSSSLAGTTRVAANTWTHLTATYDAALLRLYINGALTTSRSLTISAQTTPSPLRIGGNLVWGEYFRGQIDDVRIYNRPLSQAEIQADMDLPVGGTPDTTPPTVSVTAPENAMTVSGIVTLTASASDNVGVVGVQFYLDGTAVGSEDTSSPYSTNWNTAGATNTTHVITARARDAAGLPATSAGVTVSVNNPPHLIITQPPAGATIAASTVSVTYTTTGDLTGVDHVHFMLDSNAPVMDLTFDGAYQFTDVPPGGHTLNGFLVRADHSRIGGTDATPVSFTVTLPDTSRPTVAVTSPVLNSTIDGTLLVKAVASDDVGVTRVQFLLDGMALGGPDTAAPYEIVWDSSGTSNGTHTLSATATDPTGNLGTAADVVVTVANMGGPASTGAWSAPFNTPVVAIHQVLLPNGRVMMWDAGDFTGAGPVIWNPQTGGFTNAPQDQTDLFCTGHVMLADGTLLTLGGDTRGSGLGVRDVNAFNATTSTWSTRAPMTYARWYPTGVTLSDGRVLVMSGYADCYGSNCLSNIPEVFDPRTGSWTSWPTATYATPSYPFLFSLPDDKVLHAGSYEGRIDTRVLDLNTRTWTVLDPTPIDAGSAVMYAPDKFMKAGKWANAEAPYTSAHANVYVLDLADPQPRWRQTAPMNFARAYNVLTLLPDGTTLATGGSLSTDPADTGQGVLEAEIWSPDTETWTPMARMQNPRLYHGTAMLLPDGRVLVAGSGRYGSPEQFNGEIFSPPYLFKGARPTIGSTPTIIQPGATFFLGTPDTDVASVTMLRTGTMTHSFNPDQRFLKLPFMQTLGGVTVDAPADLGLAPPGYYLVFLVNAAGVPSVGSFVRIPAPSEDWQAPTAPTVLTAIGAVGSVSLSWSSATDNTAVTGYELYRSTSSSFVPADTNRIGQTTSLGFIDSGLAAGTYYYRVIAYDQAGNRSAPSPEAQANATADATPPTVSMTAPAPGASLSGTVTLSANASDAVGVVGVQFLLDGVAIGLEDTTAPYSILWDSRTTTVGPHNMSAVARDAAGNRTTATAVSVTVLASAPSGLVVALGFNEGTGSIAADSSASGNNGSLTNATWGPGKFGSAAVFNGTNAWVTVANAASLNLTTAMTISAWVRPATLSSWRTIVLRERAPGLSYSLYATDGVSRPPSGYVNFGSSDISIVAPSLLALNTWTHVALTYDGSALRLYVNGALVTTRTVSGSIRTSTGALRIGGNAVWGEYFAGSIDEVRIYNRALTLTEIQTDMNAPIQ